MVALKLKSLNQIKFRTLLIHYFSLSKLYIILLLFLMHVCVPVPEWVWVHKCVHTCTYEGQRKTPISTLEMTPSISFETRYLAGLELTN